MPISIEEIQSQLPELALRLRSGGEVVITKDGQPYIKLVVEHPVPPAAPRNLDQLKGAFYISDAAIDELFLAPAAPAGAPKPSPEGKAA